MNVQTRSSDIGVVIYSGPPVVDTFGPFIVRGAICTDGGHWYASWDGPTAHKVLGPYSKASHAQAHARYDAACVYAEWAAALDAAC
jgi:hypothetical protein